MAKRSGTSYTSAGNGAGCAFGIVPSPGETDQLGLLRWTRTTPNEFVEGPQHPTLSSGHIRTWRAGRSLAARAWRGTPVAAILTNALIQNRPSMEAV
jgi:hypothetical protein